MASVNDVAAAILERTDTIDTWKLQKLVYYCQAWHLVWDEEPLFPDRIEAWADGPVCRTLYDTHKGSFTVSRWAEGDPARLVDNAVETIDIVVAAYGRLSGRQLSRLTHSEAPWRDARGNLGPGVRSNREITQDAMAEYYGALDSDPDAEVVEALEAE